MLSGSKGWQILSVRISIQTRLFTHWRVISEMYNCILSWKGFNLMLLLAELSSCISSDVMAQRYRLCVEVKCFFIQLDAYQLFSSNPQHRWNSLLGITTLILLNMKPHTDEASLLFPLKENQSLETIRDSFHWEREEWCWMHAEVKVTFMIVCPVLNTVNIYWNKAENLSNKKISQASVTDPVACV